MPKSPRKQKTLKRINTPFGTVNMDVFKQGYSGPIDEVTLYTPKEPTAAEKFQMSLAATFDQCLAISRKKNADYADVGDPFKNFRACEALGVTLEKGIIVRMSDKLVRAANLLERPAQVLDESLEDTLRDLINYSAILIAYLQKKNVKASN